MPKASVRLYSENPKDKPMSFVLTDPIVYDFDSVDDLNSQFEFTILEESVSISWMLLVVGGVEIATPLDRKVYTSRGNLFQVTNNFLVLKA